MSKEPRSPLSPLRLSWGSHSRGVQSLDMSRSRATGDQWVVVQDTPPESPLLSPGRRSRNAELSPAELDAQASQLILQAFGRSGSANYKPQTSRPIPMRTHTPPPSSFGKISFSSVMGLARGRSLSKPRSSSAAPADSDARGRTRSVSPFFARRARSPSVSKIGPLRNDTGESEYEDDDETAKEDGDDWSDDDGDDDNDPETQENTTKNALYTPDAHSAEPKWDELEPDPLGEGINVVIPAKTEPFFETRTAARTRRGHGRKASKSSMLDHHQLALITGRPHFQRDRCSVRLVQGDFHASGRRYVVASDRSEESRYAMEWGINTVLRDGDELVIVTVVETDTKLDPASGAQPADRVHKLRNQQERQTLAFLLAKQATALLQRTRLNVAITCQAWHAKNSRHMLLDIVDYYEPVMLIVGSRGLGQLKGILLGSTAHYLIQKSSVPVMVARRRLKRVIKRGTAHLAPHRAPRVPLAQAAIDKAGPGRDRDVVDMRQALEREEQEEIARRDSGVAVDGDAAEDAGDEDEEEEEEEEEGRGKVAG